MGQIRVEWESWCSSGVLVWEGSLGPLSSQTSSSFDAWQKAKTEERYERERQKERVGRERASQAMGKQLWKWEKYAFAMRDRPAGSKEEAGGCQGTLTIMSSNKERESKAFNKKMRRQVLAGQIFYPWLLTVIKFSWFQWESVRYIIICLALELKINSRD